MTLPSAFIVRLMLIPLQNVVLHRDRELLDAHKHACIKLITLKLMTLSQTAWWISVH